MKHLPVSSASVPPANAPVVELIPQLHGGALRRGNPHPGNGPAPSWVRQELRNGLAKAVPALKRAMKTGRDPRRGASNALLSYRDWLDTCKVVAGISVPAQAQLGGGEIPFSILLGAAAAEEPVEEPAPLALPPRVNT
jgi:hypothetical protein